MSTDLLYRILVSGSIGALTMLIAILLCLRINRPGKMMIYPFAAIIADLLMIAAFNSL